MDKKILYSLLITVAIVFGTLFIISMIFQGIFGEIGIYISMFASTIFTLVYCTQLILSKLDKNIDK
ncbi:MAG: hypothetical protein Q3980_06135 [Turicibacter sp.]|nr:hypothetical protein [Turicibacter sp.]